MNGIIKTEDAVFNQKIETAVLEAHALMRSYSKKEQDILERIFREVINYRIALFLGRDAEKIACLDEADRLYEFLSSVGLIEDEVSDMSRKIISKLI